MAHTVKRDRIRRKQLSVRQRHRPVDLHLLVFLDHPRVEAEPRAGSNLQGRLQLLVSVLGQDLSGTSWCGQPVSGTGKVRGIKCVI